MPLPLVMHSFLVPPQTVLLRTLGVQGWHCCRNLSLGSVWDERDNDGLKHGHSALHLQKAKSTFLRCAILLKWEFRRELFGKLAWGQGLGAENDIFVYMVRCGYLYRGGLGTGMLVAVWSPQTSLRIGDDDKRGSPEGV